MPLINLIHEQRATIRRETAHRRAFSLAILAVTIIGGSCWSIAWFGTEQMRAEEHNLKLRQEKMEPIMSAITASNNQLNLLKPRLTTLQDAAATTKKWTSILDHFSRSCPEGVWLTAIRASQSGEFEPIVIELAGKAPNQEKVSEFILRIQSCKDLDSVNLKFTQGDTIETTNVITFELNCSMAGSAKPKPVEDKDKEKKA